MAWSYTLAGYTFTDTQVAGNGYVTYFPLALQKIIEHTGAIFADTSVTSNTIGIGSKTFTVSAGKPYQVGTTLRICDPANPATAYMDAIVTAYSGTSLTVTTVSAVGSGTLTAWNINLGGGATAVGSPVPLTQGGTGATTAAGARANLALDVSPVFTGTISAVNYAGSGTLSNIGAISIGTTAQPYKLTVTNNATSPGAGTGIPVAASFYGADAAQTGIQAVAYGNVPLIVATRYNGTAAVSTAIANADVIGQFSCAGYNGTAVNNSIAMRGVATEAWSSTAQGSAFTIETTKNTTLTRTEKFRIDGACVLTVGPTGLTTPVLIVDGSVATLTNGVSITGTATGGSPTLAAIGTDANIALTLAAKGINPILMTNASASTTVPATDRTLVLRNTSNTVSNTTSVSFSNSGLFTVAQVLAINESQTQAQGSLQFSTGTAGGVLTTALKIDNAQRTLVGHTASVNTGVQAGLQVIGTSADAFASISRFSADTARGGLILYKSRGATKGTQAAVINGDGLAELDFAGFDGTNPIISAQIVGSVTGAVSSGIVPTRLQFNTMNAAGAMVNALTISNAQAATFASTVSSTSLIAPILTTGAGPTQLQLANSTVINCTNLAGSANIPVNCSGVQFNGGGTTLSNYQQGTWTPIDASGAGLSIASIFSANYTRIGNLVFIQCHIGYPINANGAQIEIGGLPFTVGNYCTAALECNASLSSPYVSFRSGGTTAKIFTTPEAGVPNSAFGFSGNFIIFSGVYKI